MRIKSVNGSTGETVLWKGRSVETGIFKTPLAGRIMIRKLNLDGDRQSDLTVHGGTDKAVYSYDLVDYGSWRDELKRELLPGMFGENLTTEGLLDREVCAGDVLAAGEAVLQATQPRLPCYKLSLRFNDDLMPKRFVNAGRWGIYFRVLEEGAVEAGDKLEFVSRDPRRVTIDALARLAVGERPDRDAVLRALEISTLTESWQRLLIELLEQQEKTK